MSDEADTLNASAADIKANEFERRDKSEENAHKRAIFGVAVDVTIAVGRVRPSVSELLKLRRDSLIPLDVRIDDPVEVMVGKKVIARGELQQVEGERLGVRLTEIVDLTAPF